MPTPCANANEPSPASRDRWLRLAGAGVSVAQAQKRARHCSPQLTSSIYRFGFDEDAAAIAKLPSLAGAAG